MKPPVFWRSLDELEGNPEFERWLHAEFPSAASEFSLEMHRREFLRIMGASLALAGLGACTKQPLEKIVPYVKQPEEVIPGKPLRFASATTFGGYGQGIVVTSHEGRPTKIEGNAAHPASLGATSVWAQADLLDLYDPDRAQSVMNGDEISTWGNFLQYLNLELVRFGKTGGVGLRFLAPAMASPTLARQWQSLFQKFPQARLHSWEPLTRDGARPADGAGEVGYDFTKAKMVVALDSDFLYAHPMALRHARDFAGARRVRGAAGAAMSRFYAAEPTPTVTGSNADHRLPVAAREIRMLATTLLAHLNGSAPAANQPEITAWLTNAGRDLQANHGASIVLAGETQPPEVHALVAQINQTLGNAGATVLPAAAVEAAPANQLESLRSLVTDMNSGAVEMLVILGGNPVYDAPVDFAFGEALQKVKLRAHYSLSPNETSDLCHWLIPAAHFLESWSDVRAFDGTASIVQPLIEPLYDCIQLHELIEAFVRQPIRSAYDIVRATWQVTDQGPAFEKNWREALNQGVVHGNLPAAVTGTTAFVASPSLRPAEPNGLELLFRPDPNLLDGRYANNGWLQELPKPFSKLTWDNAALVSPKLAARYQLVSGDYIELTSDGRKIDAPVWITPGQAENSVTLQLGSGRQLAGRVGTNKGYNAYKLRSSGALWFRGGLSIRKLDKTEKFATTQHHFTIDGRDMLRAGTLAEFRAKPKFAAEIGETPGHDETLYNPDEFAKKGYAWGMVIDLNICIGCNACTIACQAENNIPVVGKSQVIAGREMQWIRVDSYRAGSADAPEFNHQPVPCMHCEHAPCELVCPVGATVHDDEGLNLQVYNRCVGTRYCSNNCPYKVRRFNFLEYNGNLSPTEKLVKNPDVTVRSRGVMEKCTYCLQRINAARYAAELDNNRKIRDGEITPACAQVCPAAAITFGDIHDPQSRVAQLKKLPLDYGMLAELNTRPRTSYLAKLRNPGPGLNS